MAAPPDRKLQREGRRFGISGGRFLLIGVVLLIPGVLLFVLGHGALAALGIVLVALGAIPTIVAVGLLLTASVAGWAARRKPFT